MIRAYFRWGGVSLCTSQGQVGRRELRPAERASTFWKDAAATPHEDLRIKSFVVSWQRGGKCFRCQRTPNTRTDSRSGASVKGWKEQHRLDPAVAVALQIEN